MTRPAVTIAVFVVLAATLVAAGAALHFGDWVWYAGGITAGLLVTLTDRRAFYGSASARAQPSARRRMDRA